MVQLLINSGTSKQTGLLMTELTEETNFPRWCGALNIRFQEGGAFKEDETRTGRVFILFWEGGGDFIERQWLLSAAQCVLISPSCIHWSTTAHHGSLPMPWISSRTFPGFGKYLRSHLLCSPTLSRVTSSVIQMIKNRTWRRKITLCNTQSVLLG